MVCSLCSGSGFVSIQKIVDGMLLSFAKKCSCDHTNLPIEKFGAQPTEIKAQIIASLSKLGYKGAPINAIKGLVNAGLSAQAEQDKREGKRRTED